METNHCKLSLLLSVGGKRKCSFVFFSSLPFFLLFFTFANKTHLTGSPSLELLPPAPKPSLWNAAHGSAQLQGQDKATSCSSPGCPRCSGTARARASPGAGAEPGHSRALHPRERPGKSREGEGDYLELQEQFQGAGSCWLCRHRHRAAKGAGGSQGWRAGLLHSAEQTGMLTVHLCLFHLTTALGSVPSAPWLSFFQNIENPLCCFLVPMDQRFVLLIASPSQTNLLLFPLIAVYFPTLPVGGFGVFIANYSSCSSAGGNTSQPIFNCC